MTIETMLDLLDLNLNESSVVDGGQMPFPRNLRVNLLNRAQDIVVGRLERHFREPLDQSTEDISLGSNGEYDLTSLTPDPYQTTKGIDGVKHEDGYFCYRITFDEYRQNMNRGYAYESERPVYYIRGTTIYVEPFTSGDEIDVYYFSAPTAMAYDGTPGNSVDCEFNDDVCDIIISQATAIAMEQLATRTMNMAAENLSILIRSRTDEKIKRLNISVPMSETLKFGIRYDNGMWNTFPTRSGRYNILTDNRN